MSKMTRDLTIEEVIDWVTKHNPDTMAGIDNNQLCILTKASPKNLKVPEGWSYQKKIGLTNKLGFYRNIKIITM